MLPFRSIILLIVASAVGQTQTNADEVDTDIPSEIRDKYLVIVCAEREFGAVKREAKESALPPGSNFQ